MEWLKSIEELKGVKPLYRIAKRRAKLGPLEGVVHLYKHSNRRTDMARMLFKLPEESGLPDVVYVTFLRDDEGAIYAMMTLTPGEDSYKARRVGGARYELTCQALRDFLGDGSRRFRLVPIYKTLFRIEWMEP